MFKILNVLCLGTAALLLFACGPTEKINLEIDNASDQALKVEIDSWSTHLEPRSSVEDSFAVGSHALKVTDAAGKVILEKEIDLENEEGNGLLNVSGVQYITDWQLMSAVNDYSDLYNYSFKHGDLEVPQVRGELLGSPEDLILYGNWSYGVSDTFPETVELYGSTTAWIGKLWRFDEYLDLMKTIVYDREQAIKEEQDQWKRQEEDIKAEIDAIWEDSDEETQKLVKELNENIEKILEQ